MSFVADPSDAIHGFHFKRVADDASKAETALSGSVKRRNSILLVRTHSILRV